MLTAITLAALASAPAAAADHEFSVEYGISSATDDRFDLVHDRDRISTFGLRGAVAVHDRVNILVGWQTGSWGAEIDNYGYDYDYYDEDYDYYDEGGIAAAYRGHRLTLGPKADLEFGGYFHPYATLQGVLYVGTLLVDDDTEADDNLNQLKATGLQPGGRAGLGFDIRPYTAGALTFGFHIEGGYELTAVGAYKAEAPTNPNTQIEIARYGFGGFYGTAGIGVYF